MNYLFFSLSRSSHFEVCCNTDLDSTASLPFIPFSEPNATYRLLSKIQFCMTGIPFSGLSQFSENTMFKQNVM